MKKALLWRAAVCAALCAGLVFMGCQEDSDPGPDKPVTPTDWTKGLDDLAVTTGTNPGEIIYHFSATSPAADSYKLYYVEGKKDKAADIKTTGSSRDVTPATTGIIPGLESGKTYSVVVFASSNDLADAISGVKQVVAKAGSASTGGFTLTVTDIPTELNILGASLMNPSASSTPVAIGINNNGTFAFYEPGAYSMPDMTKPFATSGSYLIGLAEVNASLQPTAVYMHVGSAEGEQAIPYLFSAAHTIPWAHFKLQSGTASFDSSLVGNWSNEAAGDSEKTFIIENNGSFSVTLKPGEGLDQGTINGKLTKEENEYIMSDMTETTGQSWGGTVATYNGEHVQIVLADNNNTFTLTSNNILIQAFFGDTYHRQQGQQPTQLTLTVTGELPQNIFAAALFDSLDDLGSLDNLQELMASVVAFAQNPTNGTFSFATISPAAAFATTGSYYVALTTGMPGGAEVINYLYVGSGTTPAQFNFEQLTGNSIPWAQFAEYTGGGGEPTDDPLTLTVTGIPTELSIAGASLINEETPVAVAINANGSFTFYVPDFTTMPGTPIPSSEPFTTLGTYRLVLATMAGQQYVYIGAGGAYTFTAAVGSTLAWSNSTFVDPSQIQPTDDPLTLSVSDIPQEASIAGASLISTQTNQPVAVAMNQQGSFTFYIPDFIIMPGTPLPSSESFTELGTYRLVLATMAGQQYVYIGAGGTYTFTAANGNTLAWSNNTFVDPSLLGP